MKKFALGLSLLAGALFLSACDRAIDRAALGAAYVSKGDMHGSAVYIGHNLFLTAAHVADPELPKNPMTGEPIKITGKADLPFIVKAWGHEYTAKVKWFDHTTELGVLEIEGDAHGAPSVALACGEPDVSVGDQLEAVGNPYEFQNFHSFGYVAEPVGPHQIVDTDRISLLANMTLAPGMSGGPVFDRWGALAGITSATATIAGVPLPMGFVIPRSVICKQLHQKGEA